jgi:lipopolysaccharide biosynthesis glycosyltransferase
MIRQDSTHMLPPVVCGVDDNYVMPLCAMMRSLADAHVDDVAGLRLIVLHEGLSLAGEHTIRLHAAQIGLHAELRQLPDRTTAGLPVSGWVSGAVYLRLSIADVLPDEPKALYLDTDLLVLGNLRPLLTLDLSGAMLAAVRDPQNPLLGGGIALPGWRGLGLPGGREYFNSGVMLLDLDQARKAGLFDRARQFLEEHPEKVQFWDQDALNWAADDAWHRLDRTWNTFALSPLAARPGFIHYAEPVIALRTLLDDEPAASILHFAGPDKPWKNSYPNSRLADLYRQYLVGSHPGSAA